MQIYGHLNRYRKVIWKKFNTLSGKRSQQIRCRSNASQYNKGHIWKTQLALYSSAKKLKVLLLRSQTKHRCPLSPLPFNTALEVLIREIRQEKNKGIQIWRKQLKLSLLAENMTENTKDHTKVKLIDKVIKVSGY